MLRLLKNWLFKASKQNIKPLSRIKVKRLLKAKLNESAEEVLILSSMVLVFRGYTANKIYFRVIVPQEYPPRDSKTEAKNGQIIYFYKDEFENIEYYES